MCSLLPLQNLISFKSEKCTRVGEGTEWEGGESGRRNRVGGGGEGIKANQTQ